MSIAEQRPAVNTQYSNSLFSPSAPTTTATQNNTHNIAWYFDTFIAEPNRGYALMNPSGHDAKYSRRSNPLTDDMIRGSFNGETRRLPDAERRWSSVPISYAAIPQTKNGLARNIVLDVDDGGRLALLKVLETCQRFGLWAFAQTGQSADHDGGHIYILGDSWQSASMLREIGQRLALAAGVVVEVYPKNADLRLPLMTHLRAPGGPRRFPLIFSDGEIVDAADPWAALDLLCAKAQYTTPQQWTALLDKLPKMPVGGGDAKPSARHRSKVVPSSVKSVIGWYNDYYDLAGLLEQAGADVNGRRLLRCPFHDDRAPSLAIYKHSDPKNGDKDVCLCFSENSNCPCSKGATGKPHFDAFDLYCLINKLAPREAVTKLVEEYNLGKRREFVIETAPAQDVTEDALTLHRKAITQDRGQLVNEAVSAAARKGEVTVIKGTPGLGKTHVAAELANKLQAQGETVGIFAPTLDVAESEWLPRLKNGFVWRSKLDLCTCHDAKYLDQCLRMGYAVPKCTDPDCPYAKQAQKAFGKVVIFQHIHLTLIDFAEFNTLIVDESPLNALVSEQTLTTGMIAGFLKRHADDMAAPLLKALQAAAAELPESMNDLRGKALMAQIEKHLGNLTFDLALDRARKSNFNVERPQPPKDTAKMVPQFLAGLLDALTFAPDAFGWGRSAKANKWAFIWQRRERAAIDAYNLLARPALIVLDGSASELVCRSLYAPWPVQFVEIGAQISPLVEVIQVTCTASTRHLVKDERLIRNLAESVAVVCDRLGVRLDGGISYQTATPILKAALGGEWLHYGGQRGHNELSNAKALAIVASPTTPPAALERKALALWPDVGTDWVKGATTGAYAARDPRLQAMNQLHALEELRQAVFRARPLTAEQPVKLLVFTPWDLSLIGLTPARIVSELPHNNSSEAKAAVERYKAGCLNAGSAIKSPISKVNIYKELPPTIENGQNLADAQSEGQPAKTTTKTNFRQLRLIRKAMGEGQPQEAISPPLPAIPELPALVAAVAPSWNDPDRVAVRKAAGLMAQQAIEDSIKTLQGAAALADHQRERLGRYGY